MTQTFEEILNGSTAAPENKQPEGQGSPPTGEIPVLAAEQEKPIEAAPAPNSGQQTGDNAGAPPAPEPNPQDEVRQVRAFQKKAEDETRKRQELEKQSEKQIGELRQQLAEMQAYLQGQQVQQPANQQPEFLDPEAVRYMQQVRERDRAEIGQELYRTRVEQSQFVMRQQKPDYDEVEAIFAEEAQKRPGLWQELAAHPVPAAYAYEEGRKIKAMREIGSDPNAYREKLKQEILAELQSAPPAQQIKPPAPAAPAPPPSLAGVPSASPQVVRGYQGPTPLDDLLSQPIIRRRS